jgi:penicillin-binding protein 1A
VILAAFGVLAIGVFIGVMAVYASFTSDLPDIAEIENFDLDQASTVVSADGKELANFAVEDRRVIPFEQIPSVMIDAQVAAEDQTFWENPCVDFRAIVRAFLQNFQAGSTVSGASTICQQLVGMRLLDPLVQADPDRRVELKVKEAILALRLGDRYPGTEGKQHIIEMYLNQVYYGNKAYGVWAAANSYFGKDITSDAPEDQLTISEAATIASLVRAPSRLDPTTEAVEQEVGGEARYVVPETAQSITSRNIVLKQMLESDFISQAEYDEAVAERVVLVRPMSCSRARSCSTRAACASRRRSTTTATRPPPRNGRRSATTWTVSPTRS